MMHQPILMLQAFDDLHARLAGPHCRTSACRRHWSSAGPALDNSLLPRIELFPQKHLLKAGPQLSEGLFPKDALNRAADNLLGRAADPVGVGLTHPEIAEI